MKKIYKYELGFRTTLKVSHGAKFLSVQIQDGKPVVWVELEQGAPIQIYTIYQVGTGQSFDVGPEHISTILDGDFVWHYYVERGAIQ